MKRSITEALAYLAIGIMLTASYVELCKLSGTRGYSTESSHPHSSNR